ncbi:MAG: sel1 repeat family protein [Thermoguttaceae bacterium]|nr:sel1 repeat family protein [Thermoguttaceae bacterium]
MRTIHNIRSLLILAFVAATALAASLAFDASRSSFTYGQEVDIAELTADAENGDPAAMALLGDYYTNGTYVEKDDAQAFKYYKMLADSGDEDYVGIASAAVGEMYSVGTGVAKDDQKAFEYFSRSAEAGCSAGMYGQGIYYLSGIGVAKDETKAVDLFNRAIEAGDSRGKLGLALAYFDGVGGLPKDVDQAKKLAQEARQEVASPTFQAYCDDVLLKMNGAIAHDIGYRVGYVIGRLLCIGIVIGLVVLLVTKLTKKR